MLLSAVSVLVVAQSSSEIPEGLMNNPVYWKDSIKFYSVFTVKREEADLKYIFSVFLECSHKFKIYAE